VGRPSLILFVALGTAPAPLFAQAPSAADLWRVTATSLSTPAALETGVTAAFWNPAAPVRDASLAAGVQVVQTPEALKMGGVLVGADKALGAGWRVGLLYGRIDVRDLVRTTTSPSSEDGSIPVYEQLLGLRTSYRHGALAVGAMLEMHDARFDTERDGGLTLDAAPVDPAPCVAACPVGALQKTVEGPVIYDEQKCFGCRYCMVACPFGVPDFEWEDPTPWIRKCDFCADRLKQGLEPACVDACTMRALDAGPLVELRKQYGNIRDAEGFIYNKKVIPSVVFKF